MCMDILGRYGHQWRNAPGRGKLSIICLLPSLACIRQLAQEVHHLHKHKSCSAQHQQSTLYLSMIFPHLLSACNLQDHDVYKKRLQADGTPIDEGTKHSIGPENIDLMSKDKVDENGTACGSCYGAQTATQQCCNTCDEVWSLYMWHTACRVVLLLCQPYTCRNIFHALGQGHVIVSTSLCPQQLS